MIAKCLQMIRRGQQLFPCNGIHKRYLSLCSVHINMCTEWKVQPLRVTIKSRSNFLDDFAFASMGIYEFRMLFKAHDILFRVDIGLMKHSTFFLSLSWESVFKLNWSEPYAHQRLISWKIRCKLVDLTNWFSSVPYKKVFSKSILYRFWYALWRCFVQNIQISKNMNIYWVIRKNVRKFCEKLKNYKIIYYFKFPGSFVFNYLRYN